MSCDVALSPAYAFSLTLHGPCPGSEVDIQPLSAPVVLSMAQFFVGAPGIIDETFELASKNLKSYPSTFGYDQSGRLSTVTYATPSGQVVKTFGYQGGKLTTITLSGSGLPAGIATTKTLSYDNSGSLAAAYYS